MNITHKISLKLFGVLQKAPIVLSFYVGVIYSLYLVDNFNKDTTTIINAALAISAVLAGLCFAMSSTVEIKNKYKTRINYAGERFFHASIFLLLSAVLKYAALYFVKIDLFKGYDLISSLLVITTHGLVLPLFLFSVFDMHSGIKVMNEILWARAHDIEDWDKIV